MQVKKPQLEPDMEKWTFSKLRKEYVKGCILSPCFFNLYAESIMRNAGLDEAQAGIKIAGRNINNLRYADDKRAEIIQKLLTSEILSIDTETTGTEPMDAELVGLSAMPTTTR